MPGESTAHEHQNLRSQTVNFPSIEARNPPGLLSVKMREMEAWFFSAQQKSSYWSGSAPVRGGVAVCGKLRVNPHEVCPARSWSGASRECGKLRVNTFRLVDPIGFLPGCLDLPR